MTWILLALGLGLIVWGMWGPQAPIPPRAGDVDEPKMEGAVRREDAWRVLSKPVNTQRGQAERRRVSVTRGLAVGGGAVLLIASVLVGNLGARDETPPRSPEGDGSPPPASQPVPGTASPTPTQPAPTTPAPAPASAQQEVLFTVEPGQVASEIAANLLAAGLIKEETAFLNRLAERDLETALKAGDFQLKTEMSVDEVIDVLTS